MRSMISRHDWVVRCPLPGATVQIIYKWFLHIGLRLVGRNLEYKYDSYKPCCLCEGPGLLSVPLPALPLLLCPPVWPAWLNAAHQLRQVNTTFHSDVDRSSYTGGWNPKAIKTSMKKYEVFSTTAWSYCVTKRSVTGLLLAYIRVLESHCFVWVTQMNHLPMNIDHEKHQDWLSMQVPDLQPTEPALHSADVWTRLLVLCHPLYFSYTPPVMSSSPPSTTGSVDTSTFKSNTSKSVMEENITSKFVGRTDKSSWNYR